ncbi:hypothetical protein LTR17_026184 [Elasticomyces elasticus]|nr:hypothetical protein LTR17_026184 [Elasticomyces elasticus]
MASLGFCGPLLERQFCLIAYGGWFFFFGSFVPLTYMMLQAELWGLPNRVLTMLPMIVNIASLVARPFAGVAADIWGRRNMMYVPAKE